MNALNKVHVTLLCIAALMAGAALIGFSVANLVREVRLWRHERAEAYRHTADAKMGRQVREAVRA
jgi:hypothetical protein